jgi:hypothetical protein
VIAEFDRLVSIFSEFFHHGQVLETFRGKGIYQRAVDVAIEKLNAGEWVRSQCVVYILACYSLILRFISSEKGK